MKYFPEELEIGKESSDNYEASFLELDVKIRTQKFQVGVFNKRESFPFSVGSQEFLKAREVSVSLSLTSQYYLISFKL